MATTFQKCQKLSQRPLACVPVRVVVGVLCFLGCVNAYLTRINLSMIIVAMVKQEHTRASYCLQKPEASACHDNSTGEYITTGELDWNEATKGMVLSFFFYGYSLTQIPGGRLAEIFGTKRVMGTAILTSGLLSLLSPAAARLHPGVFCALRFVMGLCQGATYPSLHALLVRWIPFHQRNRFVSIVYSGGMVGVVLALPLSGFIMEHYSWDAAFYVAGALSVIWAAFWWLLVFDEPEEHVSMNEKELKLIVSNVRSSGTSKSRSSAVPWRAICTSLPFLTIIIAHAGVSFVATVLLTQYPRFLDAMFHYNLSTNSLLASVPFIANFLGRVFFGFIADGMILKSYGSLVVVRKIFAVFGMLVPAMLLVVLVAMWSNMNAVVWLVSVVMFFYGAHGSSSIVNQTDIAPNFAGTLFGIDNMVAQMVSSAAPLVVAALLSHNDSEHWKNVFILCIPFFLLPGLFYVCFASASVQHWNYHGTEEEEDGDNDQMRQKLLEDTT